MSERTAELAHRLDSEIMRLKGERIRAQRLTLSARDWATFLELADQPGNDWRRRERGCTYRGLPASLGEVTAFDGVIEIG